MRKLVKRVVSSILVPLTRWYLRKERHHTYMGTTVKILPGVFHPGLFHSTTFLLDYLTTQNLTNKKLLELGCGTALISLVAAKMGASVTASDLSKQAIDNAAGNIAKYGASVRVVHSDMFDGLNQDTFDWIVINPPYYPKPAFDERDLAWNCGPDFAYFRKLFATLRGHVHDSSEVIMVLTLGTDLNEIFRIATSNNFNLKLIREKKVLMDGKDLLYKVVPG